MILDIYEKSLDLEDYVGKNNSGREKKVVKIISGRIFSFIHGKH